jgi:hypothetical protein
MLSTGRAQMEDGTCYRPASTTARLLRSLSSFRASGHRHRRPSLIPENEMVSPLTPQSAALTTVWAARPVGIDSHSDRATALVGVIHGRGQHANHRLPRNRTRAAPPAYIALPVHTNQFLRLTTEIYRGSIHRLRGRRTSEASHASHQRTN